MPTSDEVDSPSSSYEPSEESGADSDIEDTIQRATRVADTLKEVALVLDEEEQAEQATSFARAKEAKKDETVKICLNSVAREENRGLLTQAFILWCLMLHVLTWRVKSLSLGDGLQQHSGPESPSMQWWTFDWIKLSVSHDAQEPRTLRADSKTARAILDGQGPKPEERFDNYEIQYVGLMFVHLLLSTQHLFSLFTEKLTVASVVTQTFCLAFLEIIDQTINAADCKFAGIYSFSPNRKDSYLGYTIRWLRKRLTEHMRLAINPKVAWWHRRLAWGLWTVGAVFLAKLGEPAYLVNTLECIMIAACAACEGDNLNVRPMDGQSIHEHIITVVGVEKFWYILADFVEPKGSDGIRRPSGKLLPPITDTSFWGQKVFTDIAPLSARTFYYIANGREHRWLTKTFEFQFEGRHRGMGDLPVNSMPSKESKQLVLRSQATSLPSTASARRTELEQRKKEAPKMSAKAEAAKALVDNMFSSKKGISKTKKGGGGAGAKKGKK